MAITLQAIIPIVVELDGQSLSYDVLVDSGSDLNIFDWDIAHTLGIDVEAGDAAYFVGATGVAESLFIHDVVLRMGQYRISTRAGFARLTEESYGIVGQRGFFDQFKITFDLSCEQLEITGHR